MRLTKNEPMKLLMIEDDPNKALQVKGFIQEILPYADIELKKSYQSGLSYIFLNHEKIDLIILDMSLPTYDIKPGEDGYRFRYLAGKDILNELKRRNISIKVIIVTQFERFGEGNQYINLVNLRKDLRSNFGANYIETIYYNASQSLWKTNIKNILIKEEKL